MNKKIFGVFLCVILAASAVIYVKESRRILSEPISSWLEDHRADCAVVLTGGPGRVREGFDLLAQNMVRKLVISGVFPKAQLREIFSEWPYYGGIDEKDVVLEKRSGTTYGNAQQSLPIIEALHCRDILLITSRVHMPRAYQTFGAVFPPDYVIQKRSIVGREYRPLLWTLLIEVSKSVFYDLWVY